LGHGGSASLKQEVSKDACDVDVYHAFLRAGYYSTEQQFVRRDCQAGVGCNSVGLVSHRFYDIIDIAGRFGRRAWSFASSFCREKIPRTAEQ
jgi:hypothetical protein